MGNLVLEQKNHTFIKFGEKILVISPHSLSQFTTLKGKVREAQRKLRRVVARHFAIQLVELLARGKEGFTEKTADYVLGVDPEFADSFASVLKSSVSLGGQRGITKILLSIEQKKQLWIIGYKQESSPLSKSEIEIALENLNKNKDKFIRNPITGNMEIGLEDIGWRSDKPMKVIGIDKTPKQLTKFKRIENIDFAEVIRSQSTVPVKGVESYIRNLPKSLPEIVRDPSGELRVFSGHTKLTAQELAGRRMIEVETFDIDNKGKVIKNRSSRIAGRTISPVMPEDPAVLDWVKKNSGDMITKIDDFTLAQTKGIIHDGMERGLTNSEISSNLTAQFKDWGRPGIGKQSRADLIARTETARATNQGTLLGYDQSGVVSRVEVIDGGLPNSCAACNAADGQIWTLEFARNHEILHPNCSRAFSPVIEEMIPISPEEQEWLNYVNEQNIDSRLELCKKYGLDEYQIKNLDKIDQAFVREYIDKNAKIVINSSTTSARQVVESGRMKNATELGYKISAKRKKIEDTIGRPIYSSIQTTARGSRIHGNVTFVMKEKNVINRMTVMPNDSFFCKWKSTAVPGKDYKDMATSSLMRETAADYNVMAKVPSGQTLHPSANYIDNSLSKHFSEVNMNQSFYTEAQIYGKIDLNDIEYVNIAGGGSGVTEKTREGIRALEKLCKDKNLKVNVDWEADFL